MFTLNTGLLFDNVSTANIILENLTSYNVVALQEVYHKGTQNVFASSSTFPYAVWGPDSSGNIHSRDGFSIQITKAQERYSNGLMILSKWPILEYDGLVYKTHGISLQYVSQTGALWAKIQTPEGKIFRVYTTHLQSLDVFIDASEIIFKPITSTREVRRGQMLELKEAIEEGRNVVMGDFNVPSRTTEYADMMKIFKGYRDVWEGKAGGTTNIFFRIDYILYTRGEWLLKDSKVISMPSDHNGVEATLDFPKSKPINF